MKPKLAHFDRVRLIVNSVVPVICASSSRVITTSTPSRLSFPMDFRSLIRTSASRLGTRSPAISQNRSSSSLKRQARIHQIDLDSRISRDEHLQEVGLSRRRPGTRSIACAEQSWLLPSASACIPLRHRDRSATSGITLFPIGTYCVSFTLPVLTMIKNPVDRLILREESFVASKLRDSGMRKDLAALLWGESGEKCRLTHERTLYLRIGPISTSTNPAESAFAVSGRRNVSSSLLYLGPP